METRPSVNGLIWPSAYLLASLLCLLCAQAGYGRALLILSVYMAIKHCVYMVFTELSYTDEAVTLKTGVFNFQSKRLSWSEIVDVIVRQSPIGAKLGYATLIIKTQYGGGIKLAYCTEPREIERNLKNALNRYSHIKSGATEIVIN